jgi:hypothetical protein
MSTGQAIGQKRTGAKGVATIPRAFLRVIQAVRCNQVRSVEALAGFILGVARNVLRELYARRSQAGETFMG